jgi:hypothetical protein
MAITINDERETLVTPAAANITVNLPVGVANGDYVIVSVLSNAGTITSPPAGWTNIDTEYVQSNPKHAVFGKFWATGDPTTVTVTVTSVTKTAIAACFSGVDPTTPLDVISAGGTGSTNSNAITAATMTTVTANCMLVFFAGINSSSQTFGATAGTANLQIETSAVKRQGMYLETLGAAGATGTRVAAASSSSLAWTAIMLALRPAAGAAGVRLRAII